MATVSRAVPLIGFGSFVLWGILYLVSCAPAKKARQIEAVFQIGKLSGNACRIQWKSWRWRIFHCLVKVRSYALSKHLEVKISFLFPWHIPIISSNQPRVWYLSISTTFSWISDTDCVHVYDADLKKWIDTWKTLLNMVPLVVAVRGTAWTYEPIMRKAGSLAAIIVHVS